MAVDTRPTDSDLLEPLLAGLRKRFEKTGNPIFVWEAIRHTRTEPFGAAPLPNWIEQYLVATAGALHGILRQVYDRKIIGSAAVGRVPGALGFKASAFTKNARESKVWRLVQRVDNAKRAELPADAHIEAFEKEMNVTPRHRKRLVARERKRRSEG